MATRDSSARFRPATDFPRSVEQLNRQEADALYKEMRECLTFTNRPSSEVQGTTIEFKLD